mgnify:CR=1 FL=1
MTRSGRKRIIVMWLALHIRGALLWSDNKNWSFELCKEKQRKKKQRNGNYVFNNMNCVSKKQRPCVVSTTVLQKIKGLRVWPPDTEEKRREDIFLCITQNVAFEFLTFWHFPPIFVLLKLTCLVTLFDRKLQVFKNSAN